MKKEGDWEAKDPHPPAPSPVNGEGGPKGSFSRSGFRMTTRFDIFDHAYAGGTPAAPTTERNEGRRGITTEKTEQQSRRGGCRRKIFGMEVILFAIGQKLTYFSHLANAIDIGKFFDFVFAHL